MKDAFPMDPIPTKLTIGDGSLHVTLGKNSREAIAAVDAERTQRAYAAGAAADKCAATQHTAGGVGYDQLFGAGYVVHDHMKDFALQKAVEAAVEQALGHASGSPEVVAVAVVKAYKAAKAELDKV